jgi:hypothetical protein
MNQFEQALWEATNNDSHYELSYYSVKPKERGALQLNEYALPNNYRFLRGSGHIDNIAKNLVRTRMEFSDAKLKQVLNQYTAWTTTSIKEAVGLLKDKKVPKYVEDSYCNPDGFYILYDITEGLYLEERLFDVLHMQISCLPGSTAFLWGGTKFPTTHYIESLKTVEKNGLITWWSKEYFGKTPGSTIVKIQY